MKYLVQLMVMFSDILIVLACIVLFYSMVRMQNVFFGIISIFLILMTYRTWKDQGGFIAWKRKNQKAFSKNWDEMVRKK